MKIRERRSRAETLAPVVLAQVAAEASAVALAPARSFRTVTIFT